MKDSDIVTDGYELKSDEDTSAIKPKSFYSGKKYVSPLERRKLSVLQGERADSNSKVAVQSRQQKPKAAKKKNSIKVWKKENENKRKLPAKAPEPPKKKLQSEKTVIIPLKENSGEKVVCENTTPQPINKKKFFTSRSEVKANATSISWNSKFQLRFRAAVGAPSPKGVRTPQPSEPQFVHLNLKRTSTQFQGDKTPSVSSRVSSPVVLNLSGYEYCNSSNVPDTKNNTVMEISDSDVINDVSNADTGVGQENAAESVSDDSSKDQGKMKLYPVFSPSARIESSKPTTSGSTKRLLVPGTSPKFPKRFRSTKNSDGKEQLIIDAGQKSLGAKLCPTCGMIYSSGEEDDERMHMKHHQQFLSIVQFQGWKQEHVLGLFPDGRIIQIMSTDSKYKLKKVEEVLMVVDKELGFSSSRNLVKSNTMYLLFISSEKRVVGCLAAESISQGYKVMKPPENTEEPGASSYSLWCNAEPVKAICGVSLMWTAPWCRRKRVMTRMLDCLRIYFIPGYLVKHDELAFSDPTQNGQQLAKQYTKSENFLIYR